MITWPDTNTVLVSYKKQKFSLLNSDLSTCTHDLWNNKYNK